MKQKSDLDLVGGVNWVFAEILLCMTPVGTYRNWGHIHGQLTGIISKFSLLVKCVCVWFCLFLVTSYSFFAFILAVLSDVPFFYLTVKFFSFLALFLLWIFPWYFALLLTLDWDEHPFLLLWLYCTPYFNAYHTVIVFIFLSHLQVCKFLQTKSGNSHPLFSPLLVLLDNIQYIKSNSLKRHLWSFLCMLGLAIHREDLFWSYLLPLL